MPEFWLGKQRQLFKNLTGKILCLKIFFLTIFQASELFFFGCLMVADMALLGFLSLRFTYVRIEDTLEGGSFENSEASGNNNVNNIPLEEKKQSKDD
jgi:hypothetical protein